MAPALARQQGEARRAVGPWGDSRRLVVASLGASILFEGPGLLMAPGDQHVGTCEGAWTERRLGQGHGEASPKDRREFPARISPPFPPGCVGLWGEASAGFTLPLLPGRGQRTERVGDPSRVPQRSPASPEGLAGLFPGEGHRG